MPKLWDETIEAHRRAVRDATLDTTAALVAELGPASVTMSQIAGRAGIGRATLYKYFPDVEAILAAWQEREITGRLALLTEVRDRAGRGTGERGDATARLEAVLLAYALTAHQQPRGSVLAALQHPAPDVVRAQQQLTDLVRELLAQAAADGGIRTDVSPAELAGYCLHALAGAAELRSEAAVHRLLAVTLAGLRPGAAAS